MQAGPLELYSTTDLIAELVRRTTFLGVVVNSDQELKNGAWQGERIFTVHYNSNLDAEQACRLLSTVSNHMDRNNC
jgi:hypothetical protein